MNATTEKFIWLKEAHRKREVASLTKIMTCYLVLYLSEKLKLDIYKLNFRVSDKASKVIGTSANLIFGDRVNYFEILDFKKKIF